ncbi:MAG TPA: spore germination protein GerW family protein [Ktedonobacterales bacterium]|nr:spore germination protein GerW family protein [Ktedonobacterales bacterium]
MSPMTGARAVNGYGGQTATETIETVGRAARPDVVFGQPIERAGVTVIPCAEIVMGIGMGGGGGTSPATAPAEPSEGQGIGAGGGMQGRPVAAIVIAEGSVRIEPIVDATKVALAALTTMGFMAFWVARLVAAGRAPSASGTASRPRMPTAAALARALRRS